MAIVPSKFIRIDMKNDIHFIDSRYPSVPDLRKRAQAKIPKFAFEYLDGGCNDDVNLKRNTAQIRAVQLKPDYLVPYREPNLKTSLFGHTYDAPFGISPVGLQGLMWPKSPEILAKAAFEHNIPFVLTWNTADLFPTNDAYNLGIIGMSGQRGANKSMFDCDLIVCLGTHLSIPHTTTLYKNFSPNSKKIIVK